MSVKSMVLMSSKHFWWSSSHNNATFFFRRSLRVALACAKSGMNISNVLTRPRKDLSSLTFVGTGNFVIPSMFSGLGFTPVELMTKPPKNTYVPIFSFL